MCVCERYVCSAGTGEPAQGGGRTTRNVFIIILSSPSAETPYRRRCVLPNVKRRAPTPPSGPQRSAEEQFFRGGSFSGGALSARRRRKRGLLCSEFHVFSAPNKHCDSDSFDANVRPTFLDTDAVRLKLWKFFKLHGFKRFCFEKPRSVRSCTWAWVALHL